MITRPDEYSHTNTALAFVDSDHVRKGTSVADLTALYAYPEDKINEGGMIWVQSEQKHYILTDDTNRGSAAGWTAMTTAVSGDFLKANDSTTLTAFTAINATNGSSIFLQSTHLGESTSYSIAPDTVAMAASGLGSFYLSTDYSTSVPSAIFQDDRATPKGIEYDDDYSATFVDRSLVDKAYVDGAITTASGDYIKANTVTNLTSATTITSTTASLFIQGYAGNSLNMDSNGLVLTAVTDFQLNFSASADTAQFTDTTASPKGLQYAADYSATFGVRSLVDKAYVDAAVVGAGGITNSGASNELVKSDGTNVIGTGLYNPSTGVFNTAAVTGATNGNALTIKAGASVDGNGGNLTLTSGVASGTGNTGTTIIEGRITTITGAGDDGGAKGEVGLSSSSAQLAHLTAADLVNSSVTLQETSAAMYVGTNYGVFITEDNMSLLTNSQEYGSGVGVVFLPNATTSPTTNPTGGAIVYASGGDLYCRSSAGGLVNLVPSGAADTTGFNQIFWDDTNKEFVYNSNFDMTSSAEIYYGGLRAASSVVIGTRAGTSGPAGLHALFMQEGSSPTTDANGGWVYVNGSGELVYKNPSGTETVVAT